jgi:hypothetical protein
LEREKEFTHGVSEIVDVATRLPVHQLLHGTGGALCVASIRGEDLRDLDERPIHRQPKWKEVDV